MKHCYNPDKYGFYLSVVTRGEMGSLIEDADIQYEMDESVLDETSHSLLRKYKAMLERFMLSKGMKL